jgi:hypothetical protein
MGRTTRRYRDWRRSGRRLGFESVELLEDRALLSALTPRLVADIATGGASSNPTDLGDVGGTLFVTANDGRHGLELGTIDVVPPALPELPDQALFVGQEPLTFALAADGSNTESLEFSAEVESQAAYLDRKLGLLSATNLSENWGGLGEKWIRGTGKWYFLTPAGQLFGWGGGSMSNRTLVASLDRSFHAIPSRLFHAQAIAVDEQLGLFTTGNLSVNWGGLGEKWLRGDGDVWYFITPDGKLYEWHGGPRNAVAENRTLVAELAAEYHTHPPRLYDASAAGMFSRELGLYFSGSYSTNWGGLSEKWMRGIDSAWYYITPDGKFYQWHGGSRTSVADNSTLLATLDPGYYTHPALLFDQPSELPAVTLHIVGTTLIVAPAVDFAGTFTVTVTARQPAWVGGSGDGSETGATVTDTFEVTVGQPFIAGMDRDLGIRTPANLSVNWGGLEEKWLRGADNIWYFVIPNGDLFRWHGGSKDTVADDSTFVAALGTDVHADPALLYHAYAAELDRELGLYKPAQGFLQNSHGFDEKWLRGTGGSVGWYYVTPGGAFYEWHGGTIGNRSLVATLDVAYHNDPALLYNAQAFFLDQNLELHTTGNLHENYGGAGEKWLRGQGGVWYFIQPDGQFYRWDGTPHQASGTRLATLDTAYHADPSLLYDAYIPPNAAESAGVSTSAQPRTADSTQSTSTDQSEFSSATDSSNDVSAFDMGERLELHDAAFSAWLGPII